jgi:Permuted papain-like amidase enzyme, YaeF/YiiX, C92 family
MKRINPLFLFLLFIFTACKQRNKEQEISPDKIAAAYNQITNFKNQLQNGDLIFRNGNDAVSQAARSFNRKDTSFSHCGLVLIENDTTFVYHAIGGIFNPSQKLMRQVIDSFSNPVENTGIGAYRYPLDSLQIKKLQETVHQYYQAGLRFDLFFNFQSDDEMYCAEFVFKSLNKAMNGSLTHYVRMDTVPFGVTTDDLFLNPSSKLIKREFFTQ